MGMTEIDEFNTRINFDYALCLTPPTSGLPFLQIEHCAVSIKIDLAGGLFLALFICLDYIYQSLPVPKIKKIGIFSSLGHFDLFENGNTSRTTYFQSQPVHTAGYCGRLGEPSATSGE